jgi:hypothetical protein
LINARIRRLGEVMQEYDEDSPHAANRTIVPRGNKSSDHADRVARVRARATMHGPVRADDPVVR